MLLVGKHLLLDAEFFKSAGVLRRTKYLQVEPELGIDALDVVERDLVLEAGIAEDGAMLDTLLAEPEDETAVESFPPLKAATWIIAAPRGEAS